MLPYHAGELEIQARTGEFDEAVRNAAVIRPTLPPPLIRFLGTLPWIMLGGADDGGDVWATALFGDPGFVRAPDEQTVVIESRFGAGDPLATEGLFTERDGPVPLGLLAIDPSRRFRARINGHWDASTRRRPGLVVQVEQAYANCMKYIQRRTLAKVAGPVGSAGSKDADVVRADRELTPDDVGLAARADTFFIATVAPGTGPGLGADISHRGGHPGFLEPIGRRALRFPDYAGNSMFNTLGNLELDPRCGLLIPDLTTGDLLHVTGRAEVDYDPQPLEHHPGALRMVRLAVERTVRRPGACPLRSGAVEYSPFLPPRTGSAQPG